MKGSQEIELRVEAKSPLQTAIDRAKQAIERKNRIQSAIAQGEQELEEAKNHVADSLQALAEVSARTILDSPDDGAEAAAMRIVQAARDRVSIVAARIIGLKLSVRPADEEIIRANEELQVQTGSFTDAAIAAFRIEYEKAVNQFAVTVRRGMALGCGLGVDLSGLESVATIPNLFANEQPAVRIVEVTAYAGIPTVASRPECPEALRELKEVTNAMARLVSDINRQHDEEKREADKREWEAQRAEFGPPQTRWTSETPRFEGLDWPQPAQ